MSLMAAGYYAHCDRCDAQKMIPALDETRAWELLNRFGWHKVDLDGVKTDMCPACIAKEIEARKAPLNYL